MEKVANASTDRPMQMQWIVKKKSYETLLVVVASVLGFAVVFGLITFMELSTLVPR
jgi:hypothetical protein